MGFITPRDPYETVVEACEYKELRIHLHNPKKLNNFGFPVIVLQKEILKHINWEIMSFLDLQLKKLELSEYKFMKLFPFNGGSEGTILAHRAKVCKEMANLDTKQAQKLEQFKKSLQQQYRTNIDQLWSTERMKQFKFRGTTEESIWIVKYGSAVYEYAFRVKENSLDKSIDEYKVLFFYIII